MPFFLFQHFPSPGQGGGYCENDVDCIMGRVDCIMGNPLSLYPSPGQGGGYCENDVVCVMGKVDCVMGKVGAVRLALTFHEKAAMY